MKRLAFCVEWTFLYRICNIEFCEKIFKILSITWLIPSIRFSTNWPMKVKKNIYSCFKIWFSLYWIGFKICLLNLRWLNKYNSVQILCLNHPWRIDIESLWVTTARYACQPYLDTVCTLLFLPRRHLLIPFSHLAILYPGKI